MFAGITPQQSSDTRPSTYGRTGTGFTNNLLTQTQEWEYFLGARLSGMHVSIMNKPKASESPHFDQVIERVLRASQSMCKQYNGALSPFAGNLEDEINASIDYVEAFSSDKGVAMGRIGAVGEAFVIHRKATVTELGANAVARCTS
jgi:hypothetical protein